MILPALLGIFRLKEQIGARYDSRAIRRSQPFADAGLEVMSPLIRRVDCAKPRAQRQFR